MSATPDLLSSNEELATLLQQNMAQMRGLVEETKRLKEQLQNQQLQLSPIAASSPNNSVVQSCKPSLKIKVGTLLNYTTH